MALDLATGDELWVTELPGDALGGATVVGDLVLTSTYGGLLLAYDRETGEEVWRHDAGGAVNGWPAVVEDTMAEATALFARRFAEITLDQVAPSEQVSHPGAD